MELVTKVQLNPEQQDVEDEVQKKLKIIRKVMSNGCKVESQPSPTLVETEDTKGHRSGYDDPSIEDKQLENTTKECGEKPKDTETSPLVNTKGHSSLANSIEQLLNDCEPVESSEQRIEANSGNSTEKVKVDNGQPCGEQNGIVNSGMQGYNPDQTAKLEASPIDTALSGTNVVSPTSSRAGASKSNCVIGNGTDESGQTSNNTVTSDAVKVKQEPVDTVDNVASIPANAILTEVQPSEVHDIRNMLPPMPIPSRGPGIRHRYTMIKTAPPPDTFVCEVCQSELGSQKHLQTHKLCHFNTSHVCYACDTYFVHSDTLVMHMASLHRDLNPGGQTAMDDGQVCSVCLQRFSSQNNLAKHHNIHMVKDGKSSACRLCGVDFPGARALMSHLGSAGHIAMKVKIQSVFVCVDCRSVFSSRDSYAMHMMMRAQDEVCKGPLAGGDMPALSGPSLPAPPPQIQKVENTCTALVTQTPTITAIPHVHQNTASGGQMILQQQQEIIQTLPGLQTVPNPQAEIDGSRSSPLNLSTNNSSVSGSPHSDTTRSASAVINACSLCPMQFPTQDALALHMMYHARGGDATYSNMQENAFSRPNSAPLEGMSRTGPSPWMCGKCLYSFDTCDTLAMHMMTKHANEHDASNLAVLHAAAAANQQRKMMTSAAEIAQNVVQQMVHSIGNVQQQQQQQQQQQIVLNMENAQQQPVFPQPKIQETQVGKHAVKRPSVHSLPEDIVHEFKKRKSSQPMKKQWHCQTCEQTYPAKSEFDEHHQFCKIPPEGSEPLCPLCDVTFTDMTSLGVHLRNPVHQHKIMQLGLTNQRLYLTSRGEETDGDKSIGYYSSRSDSSTVSVYSDQGQVSLSPAFSDGQDCKMNPLNLITDGGENRPSFASNQKNRKSRGASCVTSNTLSPEPSSGAQQNQYKDSSTSECATPVQVPGHVSQSGLSPSEEEEENDHEDETEHVEVMEFLVAHAKELVMCKFCKIVYTDKTLYHLHMGLHNLNNQWQCNMCGKQCRNLHEFTSHVIHIKI